MKKDMLLKTLEQLCYDVENEVEYFTPEDKTRILLKISDLKLLISQAFEKPTF